MLCSLLKTCLSSRTSRGETKNFKIQIINNHVPRGILRSLNYSFDNNIPSSSRNENQSKTIKRTQFNFKGSIKNSSIIIKLSIVFKMGRGCANVITPFTVSVIPSQTTAVIQARPTDVWRASAQSYVVDKPSA